MNKKVLLISGLTMEDLARVTGQKLSTVRRHRREGWFEKGDVKSVAKYLAGQLLVGECRRMAKCGGIANET